jgi:TonB family protein
MSNKILLFSIMGSLLIHGAVLCLAGAISIRQSAPEEKIITVYINEEMIAATQEQEREKEEISVPDEKQEKVPASESETSAEKSLPAVGQTEDTVDLNDPSNTRYRPYLIQVRKMIEKNWSYPESPVARQMEGTTVILFSIAADGTVSDASVSSSSGSKLLDQGSLASILSAAPFEPLPASYGLNKLNIYASFSYRLTN